jgi:glycosyltransferase involved in cell wall biosynthesis
MGPLPREQTLCLLRQAEAVVLPSQVDNLANTVIESLALGIPVIGTRGASIDELVEEGVTGHLVELGDVEGLAQALANMWHRKSPLTKRLKWQSKILDDMNPDAAAANLIQLCGRQAHGINQ